MYSVVDGLAESSCDGTVVEVEMRFGPGSERGDRCINPCWCGEGSSEVIA